MSRARIAWLGAAVVVALGAGGWWFVLRGATAGREGELAVKWNGKFHGTMQLPATVNWCPVTRVGVLEAVSGDSGFAVVLYERDSLTSGPHLVVSPTLGAAVPKPGATIALRWMRMNPDTTVAGFRSESGTMRIRIVAGKASGDVNARMRSVTGNDTTVVQATFSGVPVVTTARGCT